MTWMTRWLSGDCRAPATREGADRWDAMWVGCVLKGDVRWVRLSISMVIGNHEGERWPGLRHGKEGWPVGCYPLMVSLRQGPLGVLGMRRGGDLSGA